MALVDYSVLTIGVIPIPLSPELTDTILISVNNKIAVSYDELAVDKKTTYKVKGEDAYTLRFIQTTRSKGGQLFTILKAVLQSVVGLSPSVWDYDNTTANLVKNTIILSATKCSYFDLSGLAFFINYRLIGVSFETTLDEGLTSVELSFSNYYNQDASTSGVINVVGAR